MQLTTAPNISKIDLYVRLLIGSLLILSVLVQATTPVWFALIGAYAVLTALVRWEVLYSIAWRTPEKYTLHPAG